MFHRQNILFRHIVVDKYQLKKDLSTALELSPHILWFMMGFSVSILFTTELETPALLSVNLRVMICDSWLKFEDLLVKNFELYRMLLLNILHFTLAFVTDISLLYILYLIFCNCQHKLKLFWPYPSLFCIIYYVILLYFSLYPSLTIIICLFSRLN